MFGIATGSILSAVLLIVLGEKDYGFIFLNSFLSFIICSVFYGVFLLGAMWGKNDKI